MSSRMGNPTICILRRKQRRSIARFVSDLVGTQIVGFLKPRLIFYSKGINILLFAYHFCINVTDKCDEVCNGFHKTFQGLYVLVYENQNCCNKYCLCLLPVKFTD